MDRRLRSVDSYVPVEFPKIPKGLITDPETTSDGKIFMVYVGRYLRGSEYRAVGLPDQKVIADAHLGWSERRLERAVHHLKQRGWLATAKADSGPGRGQTFAYLIRAPQMVLTPCSPVGGVAKPEPPRVTVPEPPRVAVPFNYSLSSTSNSVEINNDDDDADENSSSSFLRRNGVTDAQIRTLRRGGHRDLSPARIAQEVEWIRRGLRSSEKVRSEGAMLYVTLRDNLPAPTQILAERAHAQQLELDAQDLARRRAEAAETQTPEAREASRLRIAAVKERLRKGTA